jgi:hypothetical protein
MSWVLLILTAQRVLLHVSPVRAACLFHPEDDDLACDLALNGAAAQGAPHES